jgi:hypothetical protein
MQCCPYSIITFFTHFSLYVEISTRSETIFMLLRHQSDKGFVRLRKASAFLFRPTCSAVCVTVERVDEKGASIAALFLVCQRWWPIEWAKKEKKRAFGACQLGMIWCKAFVEHQPALTESATFSPFPSFIVLDCIVCTMESYKGVFGFPH